MWQPSLTLSSNLHCLVEIMEIHSGDHTAAQTWKSTTGTQLGSMSQRAGECVVYGTTMWVPTLWTLGCSVVGIN